MKIVITMSNGDYFTLEVENKSDDAVEKFIDFLHDEVDGKQVLKNCLIEFNDSVFFNPSQITGIKIEK
ncbi:hypothetical protein [Bacillus subtilis]|uniref:hypothetical protein n=1 Tax=Bacillus subtilis TaxID=1423 RepID=UPI002165A0E6|nr:hypothetical protein [Bacillus subtilis]MEC0451489.1 hypothetical protein [Bacillus subtilis]MEC0453272.1 hypothetical protein [Bacillus subtilis]MEC0498659.1 hypothetical protein [Bacillus subtilis]UVW12344.1 hypothetical protein NX823_14645 [Bacillus subtilis]